MDYNQKVFNKIINSKISRKYNIFSLSDSDKTKILDFDKKYGLTTDRVEFCCRCIANNCDLNETWDILKKYSSSSKEYHIAMYGYEQGMNLYKDRNKRKTKHFDFSSEKQKIRSKKGQQRQKELGNCHTTTIQYWIERHGMTEEEAKDAVAKRQKTFSLELCIERYGLELGTAIFHDRQVRWQETLQSRSDIDDINRRKSNSLEMYIERCNGNEEEGLKKYEEYRKNLHGFFGASKESIVTLQPIIDILKIKNIEYKFGVNDSEFFIWDKDNKKVRFYDLFIPKHNLIIEYHGIVWHPNPSWGKDKLDSWFHPHTKETAYQRMKIDEEKKLLAEKNGYQLIEIYSDEIKEKLIEVVGLIK